jgi:hypothetical protein
MGDKGFPRYSPSYFRALSIAEAAPRSLFLGGAEVKKKNSIFHLGSAEEEWYSYAVSKKDSVPPRLPRRHLLNNPFAEIWAAIGDLLAYPRTL